MSKLVSDGEPSGSKCKMRKPTLSIVGIFVSSLLLACIGVGAGAAGSVTETANKTCSFDALALSGRQCDVSETAALASASVSTDDDGGGGGGDVVVSVSGQTDVLQQENGKLQFSSNMTVSKGSAQYCRSLDGADNLTQTQLIDRLMAPCRYDRLERPLARLPNGTYAPGVVDVYARLYIYVMQILDSSDLQFKVRGLLQLRYSDPRLAFGQYAPNRQQPLLGEAKLRSLIWVPHIFFANEHDSSVLGTNEKDILTTIANDGTVVISTRVQATLSCWMDLQKFPFDEQECSTILESWMYNASKLLLHWDNSTPIMVDPKMHLTEYVLQSSWSNETIINTGVHDLRHGVFGGNYSSLSFTVHLTRESGYYVMEYFLPSIMIVAISWVSFWLQADQTPARTTLGTSTLLSFITLASSQENNIPKVSYIKISEVWFLGCTFFIFGSLVEFAFVNTIWRRNRNLELKKINSKYILKSTLTPSPSHHKLPSLNCGKEGGNSNNCLTLDGPIIITDYDAHLNKFNSSSFSIDDNATENNDSRKDEEAPEPLASRPSHSTMTPHEVSLYIDRKARFVFPLAFLLFNALFWTFVYCL